jgi:ubiquinone/menaquinone biosynthesis C-methylase UbiE
MASFLDVLFVRNKHVCPWYCCFTFDNIIRKIFHNPYRILNTLVRPGFTVLDIGPGQGYFSIPLARMVGEKGKVIAVDVQEKLLKVLNRRAVRAGVNETIEGRLVQGLNWNFDNEINFALAFWMVHEVPEKKEFLQTVYSSLKLEAIFLIAEPFLHVTAAMIEDTRQLCEGMGLRLIDRPKIFFSRSLLFKKKGADS